MEIQLCGVEIWSRAPDFHFLLIGVIHEWGEEITGNGFRQA